MLTADVTPILPETAVRPELLPIYDVSARHEVTNLAIAELILQRLGKDPEEWIEHVVDRPDHDRRYLIAASCAGTAHLHRVAVVLEIISLLAIGVLLIALFVHYGARVDTSQFKATGSNATGIGPFSLEVQDPARCHLRPGPGGGRGPVRDGG